MDIIIIIIALTTAAATIKCASESNQHKSLEIDTECCIAVHSVQNRMSHVHCCFVHTQKIPCLLLAVAAAAAATVTFTLTSAYPRSNSTLVQEHNHTYSLSLSLPRIFSHTKPYRHTHSHTVRSQPRSDASNVYSCWFVSLQFGSQNTAEHQQNHYYIIIIKL